MVSPACFRCATAATTSPLDLSRLQETREESCKAEFDGPAFVDVDGFVVHTVEDEAEETHGDTDPAVVLGAREGGGGVEDDGVPGFRGVQARPGIGREGDGEVEVEEVEGDGEVDEEEGAGHEEKLEESLGAEAGAGA